MKQKKDISFIDGDLRQVYLANIFLENNWNVYTYNLEHSLLGTGCIRCNTLECAISKSDLIIFPYRIDIIDEQTLLSLSPLLKNKLIFGGITTTSFDNAILQHHIQYNNYFKNNYVTRLNAIATAEGAILESLKLSPYNLHQSPSLVIGYGNCGQVLAHKLKALNSQVSILCRSLEQGAIALSNGLEFIQLNANLNPCILSKYKYIYNTIPALILTPTMLNNISIDSVVIDIASAPGGIDLSYATQKGLCAVNLPGLPGKVSPASSAHIIYEYIDNHISSHK